MVDLNNYFENKQKLFETCLNINLDINKSLNKFKINENEISFDHLIPFLFNNISFDDAIVIAKELRIHREIVDFYNKGLMYPTEIDDIIKQNNYKTPISIFDYQTINNTNRKYLDNDLVKSYLISTERVYYRFSILEKLNISDIAKSKILNKVREFSAFLLFDDDIYDLELDLNNNKSSILIQFLTKGNKIETAVNQMISILPTGKGDFEQFTNHFKNIYI